MIEKQRQIKTQRLKVFSYQGMAVSPRPKIVSGNSSGNCRPTGHFEFEFTDAKMIKRGEHELVGPKLPMIDSNL